VADEEARARAILNEMHGRILQGSPHTTLGVDQGASAEHVRGAFLELTKQFHPARFGRMANDVQRLSNEVFLGIKTAHDALMRALGVTVRGTAAGRIPTGAIPAIEKPKAPTGQTAPLPRLGSPPQRGSSPVVARTMTPTANSTNRTMPIRPGSPPAAHSTPSQGIRALARPGTPPGPRDPAAPIAPASDANTAKGVAIPPQKTAPVFDERTELQQALDHMTAKNWIGARNVLHGLAARVPASKQYRALLCYTRGREAQAAGKGEEAAMELQRALQLDPDLSQAKSALADLLRRR
jgi:hypothetical protein